MKKYITGGIAALITLAVVSMMTGQSQASSHHHSVEGAICHQQNQGVIVCPGCQGKGKYWRSEMPALPGARDSQVERYAFVDHVRSRKIFMQENIFLRLNRPFLFVCHI